MYNLSVLEGIIPSDLTYFCENDISYKLEKYKEDGVNIYYKCIMREWSLRQFEFIYNRDLNEIEIINEVSKSYPLYKKMILEYTNNIYKIISNIYIIDENYAKKLNMPQYFLDPYFRFTLTKNGISIGIVMDYIFRVKNGINVKVKIPKDYNDM